MTQQALPPTLAAMKPVIAEEGRAAGLPLHFGWPAHEQQALESGNGYAYLGNIGVVTVSGPDRLSWLTTLSSQVVSDLEPGMCREALFLDPQGRIEFQVAIVDDGQSAWLLTESAYAAGLSEFLESMRFMLRVEIRNVSGEYTGILTSAQKENSVQADTAWVEEHGGVVWTDPWPEVGPGGARYFTGDHPGSSSHFRIYVLPAAEAEPFLAERLGRGDVTGTKLPVGMLAAEATRVAAWRPLRGSEVDERTLPAELDWLRTAVHLEKGCYRGQESVARIVNLGKPPRRLVFLQLDGSAEVLPEPGEPVELAGRQVGVVTSVARHWEMGPIALALVKRNLDPNAALKVGGVDSLQELVVPVEGRSDHSPSTRPGAGLKKIDAGKRDIRTKGPGSGG